MDNQTGTDTTVSDLMLLEESQEKQEVRAKSSDGVLLLYFGIRDTCTLQDNETGQLGLNPTLPSSMRT